MATPATAALPTSFDGVRLTTERLVLRAYADTDRAAFHRMYSDPDVMRYGTGAPWRSIDEATAYLDKDRRERAAGETLRLAIERRSDGATIGSCALFAFEPDSRRAEIGYSLARDAWGHGYASETAGRLLAYAFDELRLHRIEADIDPRNTASARLLERLGFRREGLLRERWIIAGEAGDSAIYGLLATDRP